MNKRSIGYKGEEIVKQYYLNNGYSFLDSNFATKTGEIDLIFYKGETIVFIEVKVIDQIDDIFDYITKNKLNFLKKTIKSYIIKNNYIQSEIRLDVSFVKDNSIYEIYENVQF